MSSRPQGWDLASVEHVQPRERETVYQINNDTAPLSHGQTTVSSAAPGRASTVLAPYPDHDNRRHDPPRPARNAAFAASSDAASLSSTQASTGSSPPPSAAASSARARARPREYSVALSKEPSGRPPPAVRPSPSVTTAAPSARPYVDLDGPYRTAQLAPHGTVQDADRYAAPVAVAAPQSLFANPHGIREASAPPARPASRARPVSMVAMPTFPGHLPRSNPPLGAFSGHAEPSSRPPQMPGAFPGDVAVPYRRPTDLAAPPCLANESTDQFSSNSDHWDSEGDSGSNLSTSTDATTAASDITIGKEETYLMSPAHGHWTAHGAQTTATTATQDHHGETRDHSRQTHQVPHAQILRRAGHKSMLSSSDKTVSSSSTKSLATASHRPTKTASCSSGSGAGSLSTRRNSQGGGPNIHIELHKPTTRRESASECRIQQKIEMVLRDHLDRVEQRKAESKEPASAPAPAPVVLPPPKPSLTVRFAEPMQQEKPAQAPIPPDREKTLREELVLQGKEVQKLEREVEKRDLIIKERERADLDRTLREERAQAERDKERERERQRMEMEKRDLQKAHKAEQQERERERQEHERDKKEAEKAQKAHDKELAKERQRLEKGKKELEEGKDQIRKAQAEHDLLHLSFMDQGKILADLKRRFDAQAKKLETTETERQELQRAKDEFENKCADLSKSLSHVSDKERYVVEQVASLQIIKESLQKRVGPLEERVTKLSTENREFDEERDGMMKDLKKYLEQITELEKETKRLIEEKRGFMAQIGDLEKRKAELRDQVKGLQGQLCSLEASLEARANDYAEHIAVLRNEHKTQLEGLEAHIAGLSTQHQVRLAALEEQVAGLNEHVDGAHDHVKELESRLADGQSKYAALAAEKEGLSIDLEGHKLYAVEQEVAIMTLRDDLARRSDAMTKLQEANKALQAEQEELPRPADETGVGPMTETSAYETLRTQNDELVMARSSLEAQNAQLEALVASTKTELEGQLAATRTDLEARIAQGEGEHAAMRSALAAALASQATLDDTAATVSALEEAAAKVPALLSEKAALEAKTAELESKTADLEAKASGLEAEATQLPVLRSECAKLAEQLAAANKLIDGLTAVQQAAATSTPAGMASPAVTPLSPTFPPPPASAAESPKLAPQPDRPHKTRSRAPSIVRSASSRASSKRSGAVKDDIALVMVRNPADRGAVHVIRKCDLRDLKTSTPRSRSQPPQKE